MEASRKDLLLTLSRAETVTLFLALVRRWLELPRGNEEAKALNHCLVELDRSLRAPGERHG